jgi:hypothetical protein
VGLKNNKKLTLDIFHHETNLERPLNYPFSIQITVFHVANHVQDNVAKLSLKTLLSLLSPYKNVLAIKKKMSTGFFNL